MVLKLGVNHKTIAGLIQEKKCVAFDKERAGFTGFSTQIYFIAEDE
jgi:hypothetical protein